MPGLGWWDPKGPAGPPSGPCWYLRPRLFAPQAEDLFEKLYVGRLLQAPGALGVDQVDSFALLAYLRDDPAGR
jgi:hypothetical protein